MLRIENKVVRLTVSVLHLHKPQRNCFAGGVAKNPCLKYLLGDALGCEVKVPEDPQMVGAYGAALVASEAIGHHYALRSNLKE
ncbi:MAG: FGGY-family carbohydrate kinase [Thermodesulfobacteriota bacterium]|jgi:(R)-2-hydroxyacyl-CoA dehydratese activating ATPase